MIRSLTSDDLGAALSLLELAGLAGAKANLMRYLRYQPRCGWGAVEDERLVGIVTVLQQGTAGFVGAMAVHPEHRGAGLGRRLLEHAHDVARRAGVTTFLLEATPLGEHLYRRLGYVVEHGTLILLRDAVMTPSPERIEACDHAAIANLDRSATGVDRADMIADLLAEGGPGATLHHDGELRGAGMVIGDRLGPVLASEPGVGRALVDRLASACRVATVPEPNQPALDALARHGFTEARRLRRMRLGPSIPISTSKIWALASPGAG